MVSGNRRMSRREFVRKTLMGAAAVSGAGVLAGCKAAKAPGVPDKWDKEVDVVVVGLGGAGALAALTAHDAGAKVLVLEKLPGPGGSTALSGGYFTGVNSSVQRAKGISDSVENAVAYHLACAQGQVDEKIVRAWAENSGETIDYIVSQGVEIDAIIPDFQPEFPGAGTRSHHAKGLGKGLFEPLYNAIQSKGIEVLTETKGKALITDINGAVIGIKAEGSSGEMNIKARRAVVLTTGGFLYNRVMVRDFLKNEHIISVGCPGCEGDGIRMGMAVGANLKIMNEIAGTPAIKVPNQVIAVPSMLALGGLPFVMVNKKGQRFVREELPYDRAIIPFDVYDPIAMEYANIPAFAIFDDDVFHLGPIGYSSTPGSVWSADNMRELEAGVIVKADTIRELAQKIGVDPDGLEATVNAWNADVAQGRDSQFGRKNGLAPIAKAPFYAVNHYPGGWDTVGGLEINEKGQVINVFGQVIPRLYAAGTTAASIIGRLYPISGTCIGSGVTFGRIAGRNAAAEKPWS